MLLFQTIKLYRHISDLLFDLSDFIHLLSVLEFNALIVGCLAISLSSVVTSFSYQGFQLSFKLKSFAILLLALLVNTHKFILSSLIHSFLTLNLGCQLIILQGPLKSQN